MRNVKQSFLICGIAYDYDVPEQLGRIVVLDKVSGTKEAYDRAVELHGFVLVANEIKETE